MFYSASGGGSHVAWSMLASSFCLDNEEQAQEIADGFPHILSYLKTIESPEYPDRTQWLNDLGYKLWSEKEIRDGTVFKRFKTKLGHSRV